MNDDQDLKSKILLMRQKNFGEVEQISDEKNDNEKPNQTHSIKKTEQVVDSDENKDKNETTLTNKTNTFSENKISPDNFDYKKNLNEVAQANEKAFNLLASKFNESVEVILELTQRVEKLETTLKLQLMQQSDHKKAPEQSKTGLKFFIFLLFVAGISYFFYKYDIDISILKDISKDFFTIISR